MKDKALEEEVEIEYTPPMQIMKSLVHSGLMRRVRVSKEKSEYKQFIFPSPLDAKIKFIADQFGAHLPFKLLIVDKKIKECRDVRVDFKILNTWNDNMPTAKVIKMY